MKRFIPLLFVLLFSTVLGTRVASANGPADTTPASNSGGRTGHCVNANPDPPKCCPCSEGKTQCPTCDTPCPAPAAGNGGTCTCTSSCDGSLLVTVNMTWIGHGIDYATKRGTAGCASCAGATPGVGGLPALEVHRYHRYRDTWQQSSFGQGVFSSFDMTLTLYRTNAVTGSGAMTLFDPRDLGSRNLSDAAGNGVYLDGIFSSIEGVRLYNAAMLPVVDQALATTAVLTTRDGETYTFEIIRIDSSPSTANRFGRLVRYADRNGTANGTGNDIEIAYQYAAGASDATLGFDRSRLWKMASATDAYGRTATFTYGAAKRVGRWVVTRIDLPNGEKVDYTYNNPSLAGVSGVVHPDGTQTTISVTQDASTQAQVIHYFDPAAEGTHRKKDVYLTNSTWVDPVTQQAYTQTGNLVRKLVNGAGEVSYLIRSAQDPIAHRNTYYVYKGGNSFFRYTTDVYGGAVQEDQAIGWSMNQDPATFTYQKVTSFAIDSTYRRLLGETDILGRSTKYKRDIVTGALLKTTFPDGSFATTTYNGFRQPLVEVDRIGRKTEQVYDARGNLLSRTKAVGTADQATWNWTYNAKGQMVTATDANGNVTDYAYTVEGYLASVTEPADVAGGPRAVTSYGYDAAGRVTSVTDPAGRVTTYAYDARNRVTGTTYNDGTVESHVYGTGVDANLKAQTTDRLGNVTKYVYDLAGREAQRVEAFGRPEAVSRSTSYLAGTDLEAARTDRGETTTYGYDDYNRRVSTTVRPNTATLLTDYTVYDTARRVDHRIDRYGRKTFHVYDLNDRMVRTVQETVPGGVSGPPAGLPRVLTPNAPYLIADVVHDAAGQVLARFDGRGIQKKTEYDGQGRTIREIEAFGAAEAGKTEYDYDPQGNRVRVWHPRHFTEPGGFVTEYAYTGRNLLASVTWAKGRAEQATESYGYDLDRKRSLRVDGRGNAWNTLWCACCGYHQAEIEPAADVDGDLSTPDARAIRVDNRDSLNHVTHEYVAPDASVLPTDAELHAPAVTLKTTTTRYDALYRPIARTVWMVELGAVDENDPPIAGDPGYPASMGLTTRWVYDDDLTDGVGLDAVYGGYLAGLGFGMGSDGSSVEETNPAVEKKVTVHDGIGRVVLSIDGAGNASSTVYDVLVNGTAGAPGTLVETAVTDGVGDTTRARHDGAARSLATIDAEGYATTIAHDADGNRLSWRDPNSVGHDSVYDARNREIARTDTQGDTTQSVYDADSNMVQTIDALGHTSSIIYDGRSRKLGSTDRIGGITSRAYDANSNLASMTDAEGGVTSYEHDARNLEIDETYPDGGMRFYAYDAARRLLSRVDQNGDTTRYIRDRADRMLQRTYPDALNDGFLYDAASRMISATSARYANTVGRSYDTAGRLVAESLTTNGQTYTTSYAYDGANRMTQLAYPDGSVMSKTYTPRNQIASVSYAGLAVASFTHDAGMRRVSTSYGNGLVENRSYRPDNRIQSIAVPGVTGFGYTYNANKNPLSQSNSVNSTDAQTYGYDADDRLTSFSRSNGDAQSWSLSLVGDWSSFSNNGVPEARTHNVVHELTSRNGQLLVYDAKGNVTHDDQGSTFAWDFENLMRSASVDGNLAQYSYDTMRRRVSKTAGGQTTVYVYDGWRAIAEYAAGASIGIPQRRFVFGDALDEVLIMVADGHLYFYHANNIGNVQGITDELGTLVEAYRYDPYGKRLVLTGAGEDDEWYSTDDTTAVLSAIGNSLAYTGQRLDAEIGRMYYKNRYYDPAIGRFMTRDPLGDGDHVGDTDEESSLTIDMSDGMDDEYERRRAQQFVNKYEYADSRPTTETDPLGLLAPCKDLDARLWAKSPHKKTRAQAKTEGCRDAEAKISGHCGVICRMFECFNPSKCFRLPGDCSLDVERFHGVKHLENVWIYEMRPPGVVHREMRWVCSMSVTTCPCFCSVKF